MAYKSKKNIIASRDEYSRYYPRFAGVDFNSDAADVNISRMAFAQNVYRDWGSEQGGAVETIPGYRKLAKLAVDGNPNGLHHWMDAEGNHRVGMHVGNRFRWIEHERRDEYNDEATGIIAVELADHHSVSFLHHDRLYLLDGTNYYRISPTMEPRKVTDIAYVPTSYADGAQYEQRNMLTNKFKNRYNLVNLSDYLTEESHGAFSFTYDDVAKTASVTGFAPDTTLDEQKVAILPEKILRNDSEYTVTAIADNAFADNAAVTAVYISRSIQRIGDGAFKNCSALKYLDTGFSAVMTGDSELSVSSLAYIGESAFSECPKLYMVALLSNVELVIGNKAFSGGDGDNGSYTPNANSKYFIIGSNIRGETCAVPATDGERSAIYRKLPFISTEKELNINVFFEGGEPTDNTNTFYYLAQSIGSGYFTGKTENVTVIPYEYSSSLTSAIVQPFEVGWNVRVSRGGAIYDATTGNVTLPGPCAIVMQDTAAGECVAYVASYNADRPVDSILNKYSFTVYDPCISLEDLTLDGASIMNNVNYSVSTVLNGEGYIDRVIVAVAEPTLLEGGVLEIHGEGAEGKFTTVKDYVNAIDGNTGYNGTAREAICGCTICASYDGRIFLSGNPRLPNTIFYSQRDLTGYNNPEYFGVLNFINDGVSNSPVVSMMATSAALCVLKGDTVQEGSIYYHTGADTGDDIVPRIYPSQQGLAGLGCLGASCNFYDDPVFISRRGLEAIGKQQVNLERTLEHRSFNVDVRLTEEDLKSARLAEWMGYLVVLVGGHIYLADSRQIFTHQTGVANYEWYYVDPVGTWTGDVERYFTLTEDNTVRGTDGVYYKISELYADMNCRTKFDFDTEPRFIDDKSYVTKGAWYRDTSSSVTLVNQVTSIKCIQDGDSYIPVDTVGEMAGGTFTPATEMVCVDDVLYLLAGDTLLCFNNDKRGVGVDIGGEAVEIDRDVIHKSYYSFCGHRYESGFATRSDNCDIPHLTKQTRRNSFIIRVKALSGARIKARGKCERGDYSQWVELSTTANDFDLSAVDFANFTTIGRDTHMCIIREKFRKWYEKQIYFYSDEYQAPFGIYSGSFRYSVQGRIRI
ncbi:MAG: leucine-rich repeat protein [Clostridia bacterium]|nr:leucine-rich repeat protein [Clostridia bacterium]